ncbi:hypothetical protein A33M_0134 [Rhodovulum sp. PH10]|nr:hypothetical protein A33M_0134 [Rhodovulum sp. PH10]
MRTLVSPSHPHAHGPRLPSRAAERPVAIGARSPVAEAPRALHPQDGNL